jgi:hypothetical protein
MKTGQAFWIVLKGNDSMRNDLEQLAPALDWQEGSNQAGPSRSFSATLLVHLHVCEWSRDNWRWYINDLEARLDQVTQAGVLFDLFGAEDDRNMYVPDSKDSDSRFDRTPNFEFKDLQHAQHIKEKASQALLNLKSDISNMSALKSHYSSLAHPTDTAWLPLWDIESFCSKLDYIMADFRVHQSSLEALISLVTDRKELVR